MELHHLLLIYKQTQPIYKSRPPYSLLYEAADCLFLTFAPVIVDSPGSPRLVSMPKVLVQSTDAHIIRKGDSSSITARSTIYIPW